MSMRRELGPRRSAVPRIAEYDRILAEVVDLLESARHAAARSVNALMTATYWEVGRRIVEFEQKGHGRAEYGSKLLDRLAADLTARFGRGFSVINLRQMRRFYVHWPKTQIRQTLSVEFAKPEPESRPRRETTDGVCRLPNSSDTV